MYCQHFGFTKSPFKITPDPELFFPGGNRGAVLDALVYAVGRGEGIVKVVGEVGSGKTMLCRMLERELPAHCDIIYLANPNLAPDDLLQTIAFELRLEVPAHASKPELTRLLQEYLLAKHADNRRVVMFVEEAQSMPIATLEELRLLSNLETARDKLLQIVLFGQPELDQKLSAHEIRQLNERITYRFKLGPFEAQEIRDYLNARLQASGYRGAELFSPRAIRSLTRHSQGLLRRINVLSDKALLAAYSCGDRGIQPKHIELAARDSEFARSGSSWSGWPWAAATLTCAAVVFGLNSSREQSARLQVPATVARVEAPHAAAGPSPTAPPIISPNYQDLRNLSVALANADTAAFSFEGDREGIDTVFDSLDRLTGVPDKVLTFSAEQVPQ